MDTDLVTARGWHADPYGDGERFHDGARWTGVTRETAASASKAAKVARAAGRRERRSRRGRVVIGALVAVVVTAVALGAAYVLQPGKVKPIVEAVGIGRPHRLLPAVTPPRPSTDYAILNTVAGGAPITYDPCKPIHYTVNPDGSPRDYLRFIKPAVAKAQAASGLEFVYDGTTSDTWEAHSSTKVGAPVLISFVPQLEDTADHPDAVGLGGSTVLTVNGVKQQHYVTGAIALLRAWFLDRSMHHRTGDEQSVVMHELGHVLGLGHVDDPSQVMNPSSHGLTAYGDGDRAGLAKLGAGHCAW